jgi:GTPase SAR1 family protein
MSNPKKTLPIIKITLLGWCKVGKTSIINKLVSKTFSPIYEPTTEVNTFQIKLNLSESEKTQKTYVNLIIEDVFGLNNTILNKPEKLIKSENIKKKRNKMCKIFREIMLSSTEKRNKLSEQEKQINKKTVKKPVNMRDEMLNDFLGENSEYIDRNGFVFVCDITNIKSYESVIKVIEKMRDIEKTNNLNYQKMIIFNKCDKLDRNKFNEEMERKRNEIEELKNKFKIDFFRVSALTGYGIEEAFRRFLYKIYQEQRNESQNDGIDDPDEEDVLKFKPQCIDKANSCTKSIFCGKALFFCGGDDDDENDSDD